MKCHELPSSSDNNNNETGKSNRIFEANCIKNSSKDVDIRSSGDGSTRRRRNLQLNKIINYGNTCGPDRGPFEKNLKAKCETICLTKSFEACKQCTNPIDVVDIACLHHDICIKKRTGNYKSCRNNPFHKHSCICSSNFIEDNNKAFKKGCKNSSKCKATA